jgi:hypothetical protein
MAQQGFVIDIEADGFDYQSTKIWTIACTDLEDSNKRLVVNPFKDKCAYAKLYEFVSGYHNPMIVFHYGLGYDIFVLMNLFGCEHTVGPDTFMGMRVQFIDSYYLSMFLNPDRPGHSIEYFGEVLGLPKIDWRGKAIELGLIESNAPAGSEFQQHHPEMDVYCIRDTDVNKMAFEYLLREWEVVYNSSFEITQAFKCGQKSFYLMSCQELTGWKFDQKLAAELEIKIAEMMEEIRAEVEPKLPPRALKKSEEKEYTFPAKPFKKDGSISSSLEKFIAKHNGSLLENNQVVLYGETYEVEAGKMLDFQLPMEMANQDQMKDWFLSEGWSPTMWNYKRGEDGKPLRDPATRELIKTTPKMQEAGKICENLMAMEGDIVKQVVRWLSLRNRQSVLKGWMSNERLAMDGRVGASRSGIAATHRQRHSTVVNVPKASDKVLLGKEFRSLWIAEDGFLIAAADAAALEGRVQGHYTWKYDGGATARELLDGDIHSKNVVAFYGNVYEYVASMYASPDFNKEDPIWKPHRDKSKNGFYCLPMHTKVLTKAGWKEYGEITEGEELLSFNQKTGLVESDIVLQKHLFTDKEVLSYGNKWDKFECTEDHRWYGWRRSRQKGKPSKKVYGYFHASEITQEHNIVLTAPWVGNQTSNFTDAECALLGWITSDGYLKWSEKSEQTSCAKGKRKAVIVNISQADSKYWKELEQVLDEVGAVYVKDRKDVPNGNTINTYRLSSKWSRPFLDRVLPGRLDKHEIDWVKVILSMTRSNLLAFYNAFYLGDGNMLGNQEIIGQNKGNICDAVITAAQLLGNGRVSLRDRNDCPSPMSSIRVQKRKHITCQELSVTSKGVQDTFCLTTRNGSFIIWQDGFIGITGNCIMYGGGAPKVASTLGISPEHGMAALEAFWEANPGTKQFRDDLEVYWGREGRKKYLKAIDGRQLCTRKKSALLNTVFQSCGGIAMDYALCKMDQWLGKMYWEDRKPYYLYKGYKVRRIGYFHDEAEFEAEEPIAEEIGEMIVKAIAWAGKFLKLNVPLDGESKTGKSWRETH